MGTRSRGCYETSRRDTYTKSRAAGRSSGREMRLELMSEDLTTDSGRATRTLAGTAIPAVVTTRPTSETGMDQTIFKCVTRLM